MKEYRDYQFFIAECDCCTHVNRNRHNVETIGGVKEGKVVGALCSWCGKPVEVGSLVIDGELAIGVIVPEGCEEEVALFLYEGETYIGYPQGVKRRG